MGHLCRLLSGQAYFL